MEQNKCASFRSQMLMAIQLNNEMNMILLFLFGSILFLFVCTSSIFEKWCGCENAERKKLTKTAYPIICNGARRFRGLTLMRN